MSRWLSRCAVCCINPETKDDPEARGRTVTEEDFLLPGGEWDPSVSTGSNRSRRSVKLRKSKSKQSNGDLASDVGSYDPPPFVPSCRKLPTFEEFRLLKTVGKGSFGKVCRHAPLQLSLLIAHTPRLSIDSVLPVCTCSPFTSTRY